MSDVVTEEYIEYLEDELENNMELLKDIREFMNRLPSEWFPEYLVALLDKEIEG